MNKITKHSSELVDALFEKFAKKGVDYDFSSTQVNAPDDLAKKVVKIGKERIKDEDVYTDPDDPSLGREDEIHCTVKYGLHTKDHEEVQKVVQDFGKIHVGLGKVDKFRPDDRDYEVLIIKVESEDLHKLNKLIADNLECTDTHPVYKPHITICYVKKGKCEELVDSEIFEALSFDTDVIVFSAADNGGKYNIKVS